jgi:dUTP pyrophosphatase
MTPIHTIMYPVLKLAIVGPFRDELRGIYEPAISAHNTSVKTNPWANSGFDLFFPEDTSFAPVGPAAVTMSSMHVKAEMVDGEDKPTAYYMYPRSSMSKTPLMLANHTGIIDSGYRGELIGAFRNVTTPDAAARNYVVSKHTRLLQICHPTLRPFLVELVDESELSDTSRGAGGFGSTGK